MIRISVLSVIFFSCTKIFVVDLLTYDVHSEPVHIYANIGMMATMFPLVCIAFADSKGYRGILFVIIFLLIISFIAPLALINILFLCGKLFFTVY